MRVWLGIGFAGALACATACSGDSDKSFSGAGGSGGSGASGGSSASGGTGGSASTGGTFASGGSSGRGGSGGSSGSTGLAGRGGSASGGTSSAGTGATAGDSGADAGETGSGGMPDGMAGKGGKGDPPGGGGAPSEDCPESAPAEMTPCEEMSRCLYVGLVCNCMGRGDDARFQCRGSGDACPATAPDDDSDCENPVGEPALDCPYPDETRCRCMGDSWQCETPPGGPPGAGGMPNGPMPPGPGEAGGPPVPPN